ncbi:expressed unknown protein [Seminavis robusta]|uniref:DUF4126 domain-containing protein n=1 Tax=Seminavis robusta TaxID=568900 RepID=A0A9N8DJ67_9STRA|nr:expressed unknown protein [Seminavis robusta]|eukprot:Sro187_g080850.1 n/a (325) ;mRNA; f:18732-19706
MSSIFDYLTSSAVSLTVSGNTGISPFFTLFLIGVIEKSDPELLHMDGWIEKVLSSWIAIIILGILTGLEFLGKCIPVLDEAIDSIEVFVVPVLSIFGSLGTLGLLDAAQAAAAGDRRLLVADGVLWFVKVVLVLTGIVLALCIHLFKMLIRLIGLTCCAGCCQPCITVVEISCVLCGVLLAIFIRQLAIITCIILLGAAGFAIYKKFFENKEDDTPQTHTTAPNMDINATTTTDNNKPNTPTSTQATSPNQNNNAPTDVENQVEIPVIVIPSTIDTAESNGSELPPPIPPPSSNPDYIEVQLSTSQEEDRNDNNNKNKKESKDN